MEPALSDQPRLTKINLNEAHIIRRSSLVSQERAQALYDLLAKNYFKPKGNSHGPYELEISIEENRLILEISDSNGLKLPMYMLSLRPYRSLVKDYFMICESYIEAAKSYDRSKLESIDMARRGIHNEGAELLQERLKEKIEVDFDTARSLWTLICVMHI